MGGKNSTFFDIIKIWYVPDIENFLPIAIFKMVATIPHKFNIVRFQRHFIVGRLCCPEFIPGIEQFLAVAIFKMAAKIQHCPISLKFNMWVDNDVPNWFPTLKNFYWSPFSKWPPQYRTRSTLSDFNNISYAGRLWWTVLIPDIEKFLPVSIFKMAAIIPRKFNIVRFQM